MTEGMRVFVNERVVLVAPGATVREVVRALDPELAAAVAEGRAYVTDGVGRVTRPSGGVAPGAILRVVLSARQGTAE